MPLLKVPKQTIRQCAHTHVSGNRCGSRSDDLGKAYKGKWFCVQHERGFVRCSECYSMLRAFQMPTD